MTAMKSQSTQNLYIVSDEDRQQRAAMVLRDVSYIIEAHFDLTSNAAADDNVGKHLDQFKRRARKGQCFHQPCMGTREFVAHFSLLDDADDLPTCDLREVDKNRDLGWMLNDIDFAAASTPRFFRAELKNGVIEVPAFHSEGVKS